MAKRGGFTLIELVIAIAIIAIIAAIAVPAYTDQIRKSRRADAHSTLGQLQLALERWRADHPSYANAGGLAGYPTMPNSDYYTFAITAADGDSFALTATPKGAQASDTKCGTLTLRYDPADPDGDGNAIDRLPNTAGCW